MADGRHKIQRLNDQTAAAVRGSQVIGSVSRAVEELILNSVQGCCRSCVISVGTNEIIVSDDGVGIDPKAMRSFIGTEYCSNENGRKGESLRSIASLCSEMKIESGCWSSGIEDTRKRKVGGEAARYIVRSEKIFRDGVVVSFSQSGGGDTASTIIPALSNISEGNAGTKITLRGLFHRMAVRRKQANQERSNSSELAQIRSCLRLLALSYPRVEFKIKDLSTGKVVCTFKSPEWALKTTTESLTLSDESRALALRLCEVYPDEFTQGDLIELACEENTHKLTSAKEGSRTNFRAFGALCIVEEEDSDIDVARNRELEIVAINGRLATYCDKLGDDIVHQVRLCRGNRSNISVRFFIHIYSNSSEVVVKDTLSTISVPQMDLLSKFLRKMIAKAIMNSKQSASNYAKNDGSENSLSTQNSSWNTGNRAVAGQQIISSYNPKFKATAATKKNGPPPHQQPPPSPFSNAFFDTGSTKPTKRIQAGKKTENTEKSTAKPDSSLLTFEDAFFEQETSVLSNSTENAGKTDLYDFDNEEDTAVASSTWTRQRIKGFERTVAAIAPEANIGTSGGMISLTKTILSKAEVIAQVEEKFIIIKACGVICAVDQHAADERVSLEKLERALFNPSMNERSEIQLTKRSIRVSEILRPIKLHPSKRLILNQKDICTTRQHGALLQKWKFTFEEEDDKTLSLTGLPSVCDRVAGVSDFLDFVKQLSHFTGGEIKPAFVKRVLASNACRYAVMFGDSLSHDKCVELIASLAKCEFCFICAHGRPSIAPLINIEDCKEHSSGKEAAAHDKVHAKSMDRNTLKFGPKRVIRR